MLVTSKELLLKAQEGGYAVGAFNVENMEMVQAVLEAAEELNSPVIMQTTPSTVKYAGLDYYLANVEAAAKRTKVPVVMHLDHGNSFELAMQAYRTGYTSIMIDGSHESFEDNIAVSKAVADACHPGKVPVEAELGIMASTDEDTHDDDPEKRVLTNEDIKEFFTEPAEAKEFAERTKCDALAVCFGTMHGIYAEPPVLDIDRVKELREAIPDETRIVMHGASGVEFDQVQNAITAGCSKVNYYSYMAKATTKFVADKVAETDGKIAYHELQEAAYEFMKGYAKDVIKAFKNGK